MYRGFFPYNRFYYNYPNRRHCYRYNCNLYNPYNYYYPNWINSDYARVDQNIFNSGIMDDVIQQSIISQVSREKISEEPCQTYSNTVSHISEGRMEINGESVALGLDKLNNMQYTI